MTSFILRESILYATENASKIYVCFLDVRKAFDRVWHDGLFVKMARFGINLPILKSLINMYTDVESCVMYQYSKSDNFEVLQGTRQGGVSSPLCYFNIY